MNRNVLVTGGAGYIGSHTCKYLASKGWNPVVLDNLVYGHEWAVKWGKLYRGELKDLSFVKDVLTNENIGSVIHFAAYAYVGESVQNPLKYYENNVFGSLCLLQAMRDAGVKQIVFSSTCASYGTPEKVPIDESFPQRPINPYGQSKLMVEQILRDVCVAEGFSAIAMRYFNASGADPELEIGEDHQPETHLIPLVIQAAFREDKPITVFGTDYPTEDGTCVRDYIHVNDLASAHELGLQFLQKNPQGFEFFNLGTEKGLSVKQIIAEVEKVSGKKVKVQFGARRQGDPPALVASSTKAKTTLGWNPQQSEIQSIIKSAVGWYRKHTLNEV